MLPPAKEQKQAVVPTIAQTNSPTRVHPMLKPLEEQKNAGAAPAQLAGTPTLQPKHQDNQPRKEPPNLPSGSSKQQNAPPTSPNPLWAGRPIPAFHEPYNKLSPTTERRNEAPLRSNLFRQPYWLGLRHRNYRPLASSLGAHTESPAPESSGSSDWTGWRDSSEWKK